MSIWQRLVSYAGKWRTPSRPDVGQPTENKITWAKGEVVDAGCPVCKSDEDQRAVLEMHLGTVAQKLLAEQKITIVQCRSCQTRYARPATSVSYEDVDRSGLKFYLEQGAGIRSMLEPFAMLDGRKIERYIEIGCSFGFSLDYARRILGWEVRGYDPGGIARAGRDLLRAPIENRYFDANGARHDADLVFCSEVIEHIPDPYGYLDLIRAALRPGGVVLLTTPNADYIEPSTPAETLLPILSPGQHVILYNAKSLQFLLNRAGFKHTKIVDNGSQLRAAASDDAFSEESNHFSGALYEQYLEEVLNEEQVDHTLRAGLACRLLKEETNTSRFALARTRYQVLRDIYKEQYGFDLDKPEFFGSYDRQDISFEEFGRRWPYNLAGIWYCEGIAQLLADQNPQEAAKTLVAATGFGIALRDLLRAFGTDDPETAVISRAAEIARLSALARFDPEGAVAAIGELRPGPDGAGSHIFRTHLQHARAQLFTDLANQGHHATAERLVGEQPAPMEELLRTGALSSLCAWGIYLLTQKADYEAAAVVFRRIWEAARDTSGNAEMLWTARFHQGLAALYRGDRDKAHEVAYEIQHPPPAFGPVPEQIARRIAELSPPGSNP